MDIPKSEVISVIYYLLPGFVAAWIFHAFTAHPKATPFERVVQALIFTAFTQVIVIPTGMFMLWLGTTRIGIWGTWSEKISFVLSVVVAIFLGVMFSAFANTSWIHFRIPDWITKRTSFPSEWFSAFNQDKRFIYLHLTGKRRLYGWPLEWPDQPDKGHFVMMQPEWILDDNTRIKLHLVERMLIPASEVEMVEFVKSENEYTHSPEEQVEAERLMIQIQKQNSEEPNNDGA